MHHYILYAAAWLFMAGFVSRKSERADAIALIVALLLGPFFFPWTLGQAIYTFIIK